MESEQTSCQVFKSGKKRKKWKKAPLERSSIAFKVGIFFLCG
jgi:hypothetical protein